jgi:hypothetical protein
MNGAGVQRFLSYLELCFAKKRMRPVVGQYREFARDDRPDDRDD